MRFTAPACLTRPMISIESTCRTLSAASGVVLWCGVPGPQLLCWVGRLGHPCKKYQWWFHIWVKQGKWDRGLVEPMASQILSNIDIDNGMSPNVISAIINLYKYISLKINKSGNYHISALKGINLRTRDLVPSDQWVTIRWPRYGNISTNKSWNVNSAITAVYHIF